jgi:CDP-4-dehydro-6-deoxyglucose reductase
MNDFENLIDFEVYACGPPVMVKAVAKSCIENKLKKENFFSDSFEYANVSTDND